jgi:hypothetical protein
MPARVSGRSPDLAALCTDQVAPDWPDVCLPILLGERDGADRIARAATIPVAFKQLPITSHHCRNNGRIRGCSAENIEQVAGPARPKSGQVRLVVLATGLVAGRASGSPGWARLDALSDVAAYSVLDSPPWPPPDPRLQGGFVATSWVGPVIQPRTSGRIGHAMPPGANERTRRARHVRRGRQPSLYCMRPLLPGARAAPAHRTRSASRSPWWPG